MTQTEFSRLALALPGVVEASHMGTKDFRVERQIFATIDYPDDTWGMVKLTQIEQERFRPVPGGWGRKGSTNVCLAAVDAPTLRAALRSAG